MIITAPVNIQLSPQSSRVEDRLTASELNEIKNSLRLFHAILTAGGVAAPPAATDLAACITLVNGIRTRLITLGVLT